MRQEREYDFRSVENICQLYKTGVAQDWSGTGLEEMRDRRKQKDRRGYGKPPSEVCGRSRFPDRRLNNISVEWVPMGLVHSHPLTHRVFEITRRVFNKN